MYFSLVLCFCLVTAAFAAPASFSKSAPELDTSMFVEMGDTFVLNPKNPATRNLVVGQHQLWINAVVPFFIREELEDVREKIYKAMNHISNRTCIRFRPKNDDDKEYIYIHNGGRCVSFIGRIGRGRKVPVSLGPGCEELIPAAHEIIHSLGAYHTQSRSDRDDYVTIHFENMYPQTAYNYVKLHPSQNHLFTPFDFKSIMLYGPYAGSYNGRPTMTARDPNQRIIDSSQKPGLSEFDIEALNKLYRCERYGPQFAYN